MTDQSKIEALMRELAGYEARGLEDRAEAVRELIKREGGEADTPADRAVRASSVKARSAKKRG